MFFEIGNGIDKKFRSVDRISSIMKGYQVHLVGSNN